MIAPDFLRQRVLATESIAVVDVRPPWRAPCGHPSDVQICSRQICLVEGQIVRTDDLHGDSRPQGCAQSLPLYGVEQGDGRNEHVPTGAKKTSKGASSAICYDKMLN